MTQPVQHSPECYITGNENNKYYDVINVEHDVEQKNGADHAKFLKGLRISNINRLVIAHLNINRIMGKFDSLREIIQENIDILAISESILDESYSTNILNIAGYTLPFRRDRNINGGGVLVYVKEGVPCHELKMKVGAENLEGIFIEINLRKTKWLLFAGYNNCKCNKFSGKYMSCPRL